MQRSIEQPVLEVLSAAIVEGAAVRLAAKLDPKLYKATDKVLKALGGSWNRRAGAHLFDTDPADALDMAILTASYAKPNQLDFFETLPEMANATVGLAGLEPGMLTLEPSGGRGALALPMASIVGFDNVVTVELDQVRYLKLVELGFKRSYQVDFLSWDTDLRFSRIVMNPPFSRQAELVHVARAWNFLEPKGRLVSIMSAGVSFRQTSKTKDLRSLIERYGRLIPNPDGSFKGSGTSVGTVTIVLDKP